MRLGEETYVDQAERVIKQLIDESDKRGKNNNPKIKRDKNNNPNIVTTSKLRNLLSMTMDIYNQVVNSTEDDLDDEVKGRIEYLRVRVVYDAGRDPQVKKFIEKAKILECLKEINGSRKNYLRFTHYMEALVAFRKYYAEDKDL